MGKRVSRADGTRSYVLNDGVYGCFGRALFDGGAADAFRPVALLGEDEDEEEQHASDLWGPTGDDLDLIGRGFGLPDVEEDDWIVFEDMGAYLMAPAALTTKLTAFEASPSGDDLWIMIKNDGFNDGVPGLLGSESSSGSSSPSESPSLSSSWSAPSVFLSLPLSEVTFHEDGGPAAGDEEEKGQRKPCF